MLTDRRSCELQLKKAFAVPDLTHREMKIVDGYVHERSYLKDEVVFDEGEEGQAIYFILKGNVLICTQQPEAKTITTLEQGSFWRVGFARQRATFSSGASSR